MDWDRFVAGFVSGLAFQLLHPLDLVRIRLQAADSSRFSNVPGYASYVDLIRQVRTRESLRSLYKGVLFSAVPNASFGFFMMFSHFFGTRLRQSPFFAERPDLAAFAAAAASALSISAVFNPFYVVKTWKVIDQHRFEQRLSFGQVVREIHRRNGLLGFLRGYSLMVVTAANGTFTLGTVEIAKRVYPDLYNRPWGVFLISGMARVLSSGLLYPLSTIRTRLQQNQSFEGLQGFKYAGVRDCVRKMWGEEGLRSFYNGLAANSVKAFMTSGVFFFLYEGVYRRLRARRAASA